VGSGPLEQQLQRQARDLRVSEWVLFTGARNDVPQILPAFDVFVLSSVHEGLPIALLEAMAAGVPVVSTDVGGVAEVVTDGIDGLIVRRSHVDGLASTLDVLLSDESARVQVSTNALRRSRDFDILRAASRLEHIYESLLERP
jgi:glycosyltransferase involved in cell wall biosynthesis